MNNWRIQGDILYTSQEVLMKSRLLPRVVNSGTLWFDSSFPVLFTPSLTSVSWDHFLSKTLIPKSLS